MAVIVRVVRRRSGVWPRFFRALPIAIGSLVICVVQLGWGATAVLIAAALGGLVAFARGRAVVLRHRLRQRAGPGTLLVAPGAISGTSGVATVTDTGVDWEPRRAGPDSVTLARSDVNGVELSPFGGFVVSATRATFRLSNAKETEIAFIAPVAEVARALEAWT